MKKYPDAEAGQTSIEYILALLLVALVLLFALERSEMATVVEESGEVIADRMLEEMSKVP